MLRRVLVLLVLLVPFRGFGGVAGDAVRVFDADAIDPEIVEVDPGTGDQTRVAGASVFTQPGDVTADATELLVLYDFPSPALVRVDPTSGSQAVVSTGGLLLDAERVENIMRQTPMQRFGEPEELIGATLLLLAPGAGSYITGACYYVDGGFTAMRF